MNAHPNLQRLIEYIIQNKASDLHISSGNYPMARIDGDLNKIPDRKPTGPIEASAMINSVMTDQQQEIFNKTMELDFSMKTDSGHRFRINAFTNINGSAAVFREIASEAMSLEKIGAPAIFNELCKLSQGLILVVGPTGSGKSTTLTSILNHINNQYKHHIITIEDPIEFVYKSQSSLINQREVFTNTKSFPAALKAAMREDPDVIMVGEMRDLETMSLALTAAETGHLVMGTLHTNSAAQTINRIIDVFPSSDKDLVRSMISSSIRAIISQRLVKKKGGGRAAVYEIMIANQSIKNLIREDKIPQINSMIEIGRKQGMVTSKDSVFDLFNRGIITEEVLENFILSSE